jgi:DNA adenine methylase
VKSDTLVRGKINPLVRPFLKWAGGKRQLLPEIVKYVPKMTSKHTYYEPFIGGGALLFELQPPKAVINDSNKELINCYKVIKDSLDELMEELSKDKYSNSETSYYEMRDLDRSTKKYASLSEVEKAARIIYLNKTCYNGLFRVNSQGQFNVPFGRYKNPNFLDDAVLRAVNKYLNSNDITLLNQDFAEAVKDAKRGDFVYFDPPYDPVSETASFTGYDVNGFNRDEQERLKKSLTLYIKEVAR